MILELAIAISAIVPLDSCRVVRQGLARTEDSVNISFELSYRGTGTPRPVVILISGAGPQRRDYSTDTGNGRTGNRAFQSLRTVLVEMGYAVVIYDERGTGSSTGDYSTTATTHVLASDVEALVRALRAEPVLSPDRVVLVGHSEGGAIAALVASRVPAISQIILLAAPAWPGARIMAWQHRQQLESKEWSYRFPSQESRLEYLEREHARRLSDDPWYRFFLTYDPLSPLDHVGVPILILQGDLDNKVAPEQALEIAGAARSAGNTRVRLKVLPMHDHSFNEPGPQRLNDSLSHMVLEEIHAWLQEVSPLEPGITRCR